MSPSISCRCQLPEGVPITEVNWSPACLAWSIASHPLPSHLNSGQAPSHGKEAEAGRVSGAVQPAQPCGERPNAGCSLRFPWDTAGCVHPRPIIEADRPWGATESAYLSWPNTSHAGIGGTLFDFPRGFSLGTRGGCCWPWGEVGLKEAFHPDCRR